MTTTQCADRRQSALCDWLSVQLDATPFDLQEVSADASFRRYFRVAARTGSWVAMDAPPEKEDCAPFVRVAGLLRDAGVHVPEIHAQDLQQGFLLLEDFGNDCYLAALDENSADALFADAIDALIAWQSASRPGVLPAYDAPTLRREMQLFDRWFLGTHLGVRLNPDEQRQLDGVYTAVIARVTAQSRVFVHRDYMPRNLMVTKPNPGVLDFQDALYGPISYDVLSLFKDAFLSWPAARVEHWVSAYWHKALAAGLPVPQSLASFMDDLDWMGVQRHLKVLGIFARIRYRDGKPAYLQDASRFVAYLTAVFARQPELAPLARLFEQHVVPTCGQ